MKRILITGKNSYIGTSVEKWLLREPDRYQVDTVDMKDESWKATDFSVYDGVFHVAGIAHISVDPKMAELYFTVNRDLAVATAEKAKAAGVRHFIFMSSMNVYGDGRSSLRVIDPNTVPLPNNYYGQSKLQAEEGLRNLESEDFRIVIIRPPMIYGRGAKGNYPKLAALAKKTPVFPDMDNERSMLHIDNLCEFIKMIVDHEETGLFFPQNRDYVQTSELVRLIAEIHGRKIWMTKVFNPLLRKMAAVEVVNKVFGSFVYDQGMSRYEKGNYQIRGFRESIKLTERPTG